MNETVFRRKTTKILGQLYANGRRHSLRQWKSADQFMLQSALGSNLSIVCYRNTIMCTFLFKNWVNALKRQLKTLDSYECEHYIQNKMTLHKKHVGLFVGVLFIHKWQGVAVFDMCHKRANPNFNSAIRTGKQQLMFSNIFHECLKIKK